MLAEQARLLARQLAENRVIPMLHNHAGGTAAHGEALRVDVCGLRSTDANRLLDALAKGLPVSVTVHLGEASDDNGFRFNELCSSVARLLRDNALPASSVELVADAALISPQVAYLCRLRHLGPGPLRLLVNGQLPDKHWLQLWHLRHSPLVSTALATHIRSPCPLLCIEAGDAIIPGVAINAPAGSAWIPVCLDLLRYARADGSLRNDALDLALAASIEAGDGLHDVCQRALAQSRHDAWFNRRLAIELVGIGALAERRGIDPASLAGLDELRAVVRHVRRRMRKLSAQMAIRRGNVPSLEQTDPTLRLPSGADKCDWQLRWRHAVDASPIRHRNLLVLSPWSVLYPQKRASFRCTDLLPLLAEADAVSFRRPQSISHWNVKEFKEFHMRAAAILEARNDRMVFAEQQ